jgi:hypothetical protein
VTRELFFATLLVNVISIILGGGIVLLFIEVRRHQRERRAWQIEDQTLQIDIPRAEIRVARWIISDDMPEKDQLIILKRKLENQIRDYTAIAEFVIRNTTPAEVVVTSYNAFVSPITVGYGQQYEHYYDLETYDLIDVEEIGAFTIKPYGVVPRYCVIGWYTRGRGLEEIPSSIIVEVTTSTGKLIQGKAVLNVVSNDFGELQVYDSFPRPKRYLRKIGVPTEEDDIPF